MHAQGLGVASSHSSVVKPPEGLVFLLVGEGVKVLLVQVVVVLLLEAGGQHSLVRLVFEECGKQLDLLQSHVFAHRGVNVNLRILILLFHVADEGLNRRDQGLVHAAGNFVVFAQTCKVIEHDCLIKQVEIHSVDHKVRHFLQKSFRGSVVFCLAILVLSVGEFGKLRFRVFVEVEVKNLWVQGRLLSFYLGSGLVLFASGRNLLSRLIRAPLERLLCLWGVSQHLVKQD